MFDPYQWRFDTTDAMATDADGFNVKVKLRETDGTMAYLSDIAPIIKTSSFTAENDQSYSNNGTITVTDPTPVANKGYIVHVVAGTTTINSIAYTAGALIYRFYNGSSWISTDMNAGGSAVWGSITGTLSSQTDLNSALSGKQDTLTETNFGTFMNARTAKNTLVDADEVVSADSADSNKAKKTSWLNVWTNYIKGKADALYALKSNTVLSTYLEVPEQSKPSTPTNATRLYVDASNRLSWVGENGFARTFDGTANTADRVYTLQNRNGIIADDTDLARIEKFIFSKANATFGSHTGTTAETVLFSADISANEFVAGDFMRVMLDITKLGTAGTANVRLRAGTAGTTSDALIGTLFLTAPTLDAGFIRERFQFLSGNLLSGIQNIFTSNQTDIALNAAIKQSTSLTPSNAWKLTVSVALSNSADTVSCLGYRVSKIKSI